MSKSKRKRSPTALPRAVFRHCRRRARTINLKHMVTIATFQTDDQPGDPTDPAVSTLMTTRVVAVSPGTTLIEALQVMDFTGVRHLPVIERSRCVGLLTETDIQRQLIAQGLLSPQRAKRLTAGQVCRRPAPAIPLRSTRAVAAQTMVATGSDAVVVLNHGGLRGIITASDLAASLAASATGEAATTSMTGRGLSAGG